MNRNTEFDAFVRKFSQEMGIPHSEVLSNIRLIKVLEEMFLKTVKQNGNKDV